MSRTTSDLRVIETRLRHDQYKRLINLSVDFMLAEEKTKIDVSQVLRAILDEYFEQKDRGCKKKK